MNKFLICVLVGASCGFLGMLILSDRLGGIYLVDGEQKTDMTPRWTLVSTLVGGLLGGAGSTKL